MFNMKMKVNQLLKIIREATGKKQRYIAEQCGIRQQSLQRYETGRASLSKDTLLKIAHFLNINPEYISDQTKNPFNSSGLIKMFFSEKFIDPVFLPTDMIVWVNSKLEFISLRTKIDIISRIKNVTPFQAPVYAVVIRDQDNNIFLLRRKSKTDFVIADGNLYDHMSYMLQARKEERKSMYFATQEIDKDLYEKIKDWSVERADVEPLFAKCKFIFYLNPTQQELGQLREQRDLQIEPLTELELVITKKLREKNISTDEVLKWTQLKK